MDQVAEIRLTLLANGRLGIQAQGPGACTFLQMLDAARTQITAEGAGKEQERAANGIQVAPPGFRPAAFAPAANGHCAK